MVIKIYLANASNRVRHDFLFLVMEHFGFDPSFIQWIKSCISELWVAPLVNGQATYFFKASWGLC